MPNTVYIGPDDKLTPEVVSRVAFNPDIKVELSNVAKNGIKKSREIVEGILERGEIVYGVTTGFGSFKDKVISSDKITELQNNLIRSHSSGVGKPFTSEMVRAILLARLNSLSQGYSGVRLELVEFLVDLINKNIIPYVPSQGSVGSSGDLAPLSHIGLLVIGEGKVIEAGEVVDSSKILAEKNIKPVGFSAKEGLAWNNGTAAMTGIGSINITRAKKLINNADAACALTLEAVVGISDAFNEQIHELRGHRGQIESAKNIRELIEGSSLVDSELHRIQDSYSLRCTPQVHGAVRDTINYVDEVLTKELNSVNDNPIILKDPPRAISGGNFHGEPIAIAMDSLGIAVSELGNISERRTAKLVDPATSNGLPAFLTHPERSGLNSGFMIPQYVAASLVSENKVLAHPASVDSIPTSANQEDHVSMGTIAARKADEIIRNTENVIAIELYSAAQGVDFRNPEKMGKGTKKIYDAVRKRVDHVSDDRIMSDDIDKIKSLVENGDLLDKPS